MKKGSHAEGLSNVFNELEKIDPTGEELNRQLVECGFNPLDLESKVKERLAKIKAGAAFVNLSNQVPDFDPLMIAAGKREKKGQSLAKKISKGKNKAD